jgi:hypothetical protein
VAWCGAARRVCSVGDRAATMWRRFGNVGVEGDELGLATASSSSSQLQARQLLRLAAVIGVLALAAVVVVVRGSASPAPLLPQVLSSLLLLFLRQGG